MKHLALLLPVLTPLLLSGQVVSTEAEKELQHRVANEINPAISIGILLPSGEAHYLNYGQLNAYGTTPDSLTLYELGSITKTFTATLVAQQLGDKLNTPVSEIYPEINNPTLKDITLHKLRNHTAGVPRLSEQFAPTDWSDPFNGYSDSLLYLELQQLQPDTNPHWSYSNFGYGLLGASLERNTNRDFESLMADLLKEAKMPYTLLEHPRSGSYMAAPTNLGIANSYWHFTGPSRYAGGLISCTHDLIHYLKFQRETNALFLADSLEDLIPTGITKLGKDLLFYRDGWFVFKPEASTEILLHNGGTGGFISFIAYNKATQAGVVMLSNAPNLLDDIGLHMLYPSFALEHPQRTIAYALADSIEKDSSLSHSSSLFSTYTQLKALDYPHNILHIYWLERYFFGKQHYNISYQLSSIMAQELPDDWEVWGIVGQNLQALDRCKEAKEAFEKALALFPGNQQVYKHLAQCEAQAN
jgi:CubicO group peptidase (beta-lactamase class C family)